MNILTFHPYIYTLYRIFFYYYYYLYKHTRIGIKYCVVGLFESVRDSLTRVGSILWPIKGLQRARIIIIIIFIVSRDSVYKLLRNYTRVTTRVNKK